MVCQLMLLNLGAATTLLHPFTRKPRERTANAPTHFIYLFIWSVYTAPPPPPPPRPLAHLTVGLSEALHLVGTRRANGPWLNSSGLSPPPPRRPARGAEDEQSEEEQGGRQDSSSSFGCRVSGWIVARIKGNDLICCKNAVTVPVFSPSCSLFLCNCPYVCKRKGNLLMNFI